MSSEWVCMCILLGVRLTLPPSKYTSVSLTFQTTALLSALQSWNLCELELQQIGGSKTTFVNYQQTQDRGDQEITD